MFAEQLLDLLGSSREVLGRLSESGRDGLSGVAKLFRGYPRLVPVMVARTGRAQRRSLAGQP